MEISPATVAKIARKREQIAQLEQEIAELWDEVGDLEVRDYAAGNYIVKVSETRRFDPALAKRALSAKEYKSILKLVPDSKVAKALLDDELYRQCQRVYGLTKKIVLVEDEDE